MHCGNTQRRETSAAGLYPRTLRERKTKKKKKKKRKIMPRPQGRKFRISKL